MRQKGSTFDANQQVLALKYARLLAEKSRELPLKSSAWQGFEEATENVELSGLLLASLQLLSEYVLDQLERPHMQSEEVISPISSSQLHSFISKDDFFDHPRRSLSVSLSPTPDPRRPSN